MTQNLFILGFSLFLLIKGSALANKYSIRLAEAFRLSKYVIGFIIVALISILPETFVSINAAIKGIPEFGLGTLFGSNVADLSLIFAIIIIYSGRGIKVESKIIKNINVYPFFLLLPLILGIDGHFSRLDGVVLVLVGAIFYYLIFRNYDDVPTQTKHQSWKSFLQLLGSLFLLFIGAHFTVEAASKLAIDIGVSPIITGMFIVALGTTMPELFFSLRSVKNENDNLAVGDILGTVLADATIVIGILALINPFYFPLKIIYLTGVFMLIASFVLIRFIHSGKILSTKEGYTLFLFWCSYILFEVLINKI